MVLIVSMKLESRNSPESNARLAVFHAYQNAALTGGGLGRRVAFIHPYYVDDSRNGFGGETACGDPAFADFDCVQCVGKPNRMEAPQPNKNFGGIWEHECAFAYAATSSRDMKKMGLAPPNGAVVAHADAWLTPSYFKELVVDEFALPRGFQCAKGYTAFTRWASYNWWWANPDYNKRLTSFQTHEPGLMFAGSWVDIYYAPRPKFAQMLALLKKFRVFQIINEMSVVSAMCNLSAWGTKIRGKGCWGGCCSIASIESIKQPDVPCGHKWNMEHPEEADAILSHWRNGPVNGSIEH